MPDGTAAAGAVVQVYTSTTSIGTPDLAPTAATTADANGYFSFDHLAEGTYNLEIVQSQDAVAFLRGIAVVDGGSRDLGAVKVAPPGSIAGRITASGGISDLRGIEVFVPGSSLLVRTAGDGTFLLAGVPAGSYELAARSDSLGSASTHDVAVRPGEVSQVPNLVLSKHLPVVETLEPTVAGPGTIVRIGGSRFGAESGALLDVTFNGVPVEDPARPDDRTIFAKVPPGARSGPVVVRVGGVPSNATAFFVVKSLALTPSSILLLVGSTQSIQVFARDDTKVETPQPALVWQLDALTATVSAPVVEGKEVGAATLTVSTGIVAATASLRVFGGRVAAVQIDPIKIRLGALENALAAKFAAVNLMTGGATNDLVTLSVSDPASVSMAPDGMVNIKAGETNGTVVVTGVSRLDLTAVATAAIVLHNVAMVSTLGDCPCHGIASDRAGNLVLTDRGGRLLYRPIVGGQLRTLAGTGARGFTDGAGPIATFAGPFGIATFRDSVYPIVVADEGNYAIRVAGGTIEAPVVYTLAGGKQGDQDGLREVAQFMCPLEVSIGPDANVYVADACLNKVRKIDLGGTVTTVAGTGMPGHRDGPALAAMFRGVTGVSVAGNGDIYVADSANRVVRRIRDGLVETYAGRLGNIEFRDGFRTDARFSSIGGFAMDAAGKLYLTDDNRLRVIEP